MESRKNDRQKNHLTLSNLSSLAKLHDTRGKYVSKRVQYLIKEQDITELIEELDALNSNMDRLLANASILKQHKNIQDSRIISDERYAKTLASLLNQIRTYADRLFNAFRSAWTPCCHASHDVALFSRHANSPKIGLSKLLKIIVQVSNDDLWQARGYHSASIVARGKRNCVQGGWHRCDPRNVRFLGTFITADSHHSSRSSPAQPVTTQTPAVPAITVTLLNQVSSSVVSSRVTNLCEAAIRAKQTQKCLDLLLRYGTSLARPRHR